MSDVSKNVTDTIADAMMGDEPKEDRRPLSTTDRTPRKVKRQAEYDGPKKKKQEKVKRDPMRGVSKTVALPVRDTLTPLTVQEAEAVDRKIIGDEVYQGLLRGFDREGSLILVGSAEAVMLRTAVMKEVRAVVDKAMADIIAHDLMRKITTGKE